MRAFRISRRVSAAGQSAPALQRRADAAEARPVRRSRDHLSRVPRARGKAEGSEAPEGARRRGEDPAQGLREQAGACARIRSGRGRCSAGAGVAVVEPRPGPVVEAAFQTGGPAGNPSMLPPALTGAGARVAAQPRIATPWTVTAILGGERSSEQSYTDSALLGRIGLEATRRFDQNWFT